MVDRCWSTPMYAARWAAAVLLIGGAITAETLQWAAGYAMVLAGLLTAFIPMFAVIRALPAWRDAEEDQGGSPRDRVVAIAVPGIMLMFSGVIVTMSTEPTGIALVGIAMVFISLTIPKTTSARQHQGEPRDHS